MEITGLLQNSQYREASVKTVEFLKKIDTLLPKPAAFSPESTRQFNLNDLSFYLPNLEYKGVSLPNFQYISRSTKAPSIQDMYAETSGNLFRLELWRTVFAGILITFIGWIIFSKSFVGTTADFASVFFWAFTLDISMATLSTLIGRVAKPI